MKNSSIDSLPRNQDLSLFDPHVTAYVCAPAQLPAFDAQAEAWFQEARKLESPEKDIDDRDYKKIVTLTRRAAERQHWKAALNLASLIIEGRDPPRGAEDSVQLIEASMQLGVPAAYDRMGTYYMNGTGVRRDATRAYAFWQRAAQMGSPEALTDLGRKLISVEDHPERDRWANESVGIKMLECAYGQGYGLAAYELGFAYSMPSEHRPTPQDLARALVAWHNGVKFGSAKCAAAVAGEFENLTTDIYRAVLHADIARSERYYLLARILELYPDYRLPNLDQILPLPPAELPAWNGDRDTLLDAARGVSHPPPAPHSPSAASHRKGRSYLAPEYSLTQTDDITADATAPFTGYWQPINGDDQPQQDSAEKTIDPALYQVGERFERAGIARRGYARDGASTVRWRNWRTVRHDQGTIPPPVISGRTRPLAPPAKPTACAASEACPVTGTWQPWMDANHSMQDSVNQYWRQAWLAAGARFPDPGLDWLLDVPTGAITWHLMDSAGVDICPA